MNRKFKREEDDTLFEAITEKTKIGVFSLGRGAGATFIATSIAKKLVECEKRMVAYVELGKIQPSMPLSYHSFGIDHRFAGKKYQSFHQELQKGNHIKNILNIDAGINWALRTPMDLETENDLSPIDELRLINNIKGEWIICDFGSDYHHEILEEMDVLFGVIDPLPSKLLSNKAVYQRLRQSEFSGGNLVWLVNRQNPGVSKKNLRLFLKEKRLPTFPLMPEEWFYAAQYNCNFPFEHPDIRSNTMPQIEELINHHILFT